MDKSLTLTGKRAEIIGLAIKELDAAIAKHGNEVWSRHEFYGIFKEEVDELWDDIKQDAPQEVMFKEMAQVMAMCIRYYESGDRYRGENTL